MKIVSTDNLDIQTVIEYFKKDVVVIPTETVYGLSASIYNEEALLNIFKLKRRPADNPLIVHVSSIDMLKTVIDGDIPKEYSKIIDKYWPGPISLLFKANKNVSKIVTAGLDTVLVRMPDNSTVLEIINKLNEPLATPSANISGRPSPSCIQHTIDDFGEDVHLYIDGGKCRVGLESTVFSYLSTPIILRPEGICIEQLEDLLSTNISVKYNFKKDKPDEICPGQKYKHYSPRNKFVLIMKDTEDITEFVKDFISCKKFAKIGILSHFNCKIRDKQFSNIEVYFLGSNNKEIASNLFRGLRKLDGHCDIIFTSGVSLEKEGEAVMDRMKKAAHHIIK